MRLDHGHSPEEIAERIGGGPRASYLRDWIYGGIDGAVTTFAIVAGAVGASLEARIVLIMGVANLVADGLSMAAANFSATRAERADYRRLKRMEERHIETFPDGERAEVRAIFREKGFAGEDLDRVVGLITRNRRAWVDTMLAEEHGQGPTIARPFRAALATFGAFVLCGAVPLLPFVAGLPAAATLATAMTAGVFFAIGSLKSLWSTTHWAVSGLETLAVGLGAAGAAYAIGWGLEKIV